MGVLWSKIQRVLSKEIQRVLSKEIQKEQLKPGDHIYTRRPDNSKSHGIYVGHEEVIHLPDQKYKVLLTSIDNFLDGGKLYLFEYGVNPVLFLAKLPGGATCSLITNTPEDVMYSAFFYLPIGFHLPDLYKRNSKDFAVFCKTGLLHLRTGRSEQAAFFLAITCAVFLPPLLLYLLSKLTPSSLTGWAATAYCSCRLACDIGAHPHVTNYERSCKILHQGLGFLPTLKAWIVLVFTIWVYLVFAVTECVTLFCWAIFHKNFSFHSWVPYNKIMVDQLQPGDHIYAWRGYSYTHHGIYAGNGEVIHIVRGRGFSMEILPSLNPSKNVVESINIYDFVCGGELYRYEYGVNVGYFIAKIRGGASTLASSDPTTDVLQRANFLLGYKPREGKKRKKNKVVFGFYDIVSNNCEDFAIYCKTSLVMRKSSILGRSGQIAWIFAPVGFFLTSSRLLFQTNNLIRVAAGCCIYSIFRIISDIKYRWNTRRIPVEQLNCFSNRENYFQFGPLKFIISGILILWMGWCLVFRLLGRGWDWSTECHNLKQLELIMLCFVFWILT